MPHKIYGHTQSGLVVCGGTSCLTFSDGGWSKTHSLLHRRVYHSGWSSSEGLLLMGGATVAARTEIIKDGNHSEESFPLKYETDLA